MSTPVPGWSYSGDPNSSDLDEVRFHLGDTDPALPLLSDGEINFLIRRFQSVYGQTASLANVMVASKAAQLVARKFAGVTTVQTDGVLVDVAKISEQYRQVAADLAVEFTEAADSDIEDDSVLGGGTSWLDDLPDFSIQPLSFGRGMTDNPQAGPQDMAGAGGFGRQPWYYFGYGG